MWAPSGLDASPSHCRSDSIFLPIALVAFLPVLSQNTLTALAHQQIVLFGGGIIILGNLCNLLLLLFATNTLSHSPCMYSVLLLHTERPKVHFTDDPEREQGCYEELLVSSDTFCSFYTGPPSSLHLSKASPHTVCVFYLRLFHLGI